MVNIDEQKIEELLSRGVEEVIDKENLRKKLLSGKVLRIKLGIDPTSPNIHLGRAISLLKLRDFQDLGHKAIFIIGDSTAVIGDSSDKDSERPMLDPEQVKKHSKTYLKQVLKILDKRGIEVHYNSEWLKKLGWLDIAKMANLFGLHEFSSREVIARRMEAGKRVSYLEMMYPLFQAYDSVMVRADVELGGTDQRFNLLTGRRVQQFYGQESQDIIMTPLIEGLDGRKMSSSFGNTINLTDSLTDIFGKIMSLKDEFIEKYFMLTTRVSLEEIRNIIKIPNHRDQKARLAFEVVKMYYGEKEAKKAEEEFNKTFRDRKPDFTKVRYPAKEVAILDLLVELHLASSKSEAKRLILQKAVKINGKTQEDWQKNIQTSIGMKIQVGPRKFLELI